MSKYRLWNNQTKKFTYIDVNNMFDLSKKINDFLALPSKSNTKKFNPGKRKFPKNYFEKNPKYIQEWTGYTDMSGSEIYEGDYIVKDGIPYFDKDKNIVYIGEVKREKGEFIYELEKLIDEDPGYLSGVKYKLSKYAQYKLIT